MKQILRTPLFWIIFTLFTAMSAFVFIKLAPTAFPLIHVDVTMDKAQALSKARAIAAEQKLGPDKFEQTASFQADSYVNTFVELEGGGKEALGHIIAEKIYEPYTWIVRHFEPSNIHELLIIFTPQGLPYGFVESITEDSTHPRLPLKEAQALAESQAKAWNIKLEYYELIETSKQENLFKRLEYTFVYEKKDTRVGEAPLRLRLVVRGNRLTELVHFLKIPDEFGRRYEEMRSLNEGLTWVAGIAVVILYILVFGLIGFIFLVKQRYLLWRGSIICAGIIALLNLLSKLNTLPQIWMQYNTALAPNAFLANFFILTAYQFVFFWAFYSIIFMVAEGLTRKAFPEHLQLSTIYVSRNASSLGVWGRTFSGYYFVFICLAFQAVFYVITARYLQWWIPSEGLFDPNILGSYIPWLEPISDALSAGSVEECLFRAIPLASAALLGARFGHRKSFIVAAFILQALIFGAAHANYPMQPAYARIVELFFISMIFGGLYLSLGLLPAIINHVIFDIVLMSMPIFMSSGKTAYINTIIIIIIALIPIFIILFSRIKERTFRTLTPEAYNKYFKAPAKLFIVKAKNIILSLITIPLKFRIISYILALVALIGCIFLGNFHADAPPLSLDREGALKVAQDFLAEHKLVLSEDYKLLSTVYNSESMPQDFIWQEGGPELFQKLLGSFINPQYWLLRFAKFSGPVEERAREYQIFVNQKGHVFRFIYQIPEALAGAKLSEEEARKIALATLSREHVKEADKLREISAIESKLPARSDWIFVYADPANNLEQGRAEISVRIAGDQVVGFEQQIHIPEKWLREEQSSDQRAMIITLLSVVPICVVLLFGLALAFSSLIFERLSRNKALLLFIALAAIFIGNIFNTAPSMMAAFSTTKSWGEQLLMGFAGDILVNLIKAGVLAALLSFIIVYKARQSVPKNFTYVYSAMSLGIFLAGVQICLPAFIPSKTPSIASLSGIGSYVPFFSSLSSSLFQYLEFVAFLVLLAIFLHQKLKEHQILVLVVLFLCGLIISGIFLGTDIPLFLSLGSALGLFFIGAWFLILRYDHALIPLALASYYGFIIIQQSITTASWYSILNASVVSIIILALGLWLFLHINKAEEVSKKI